MRYLYLTLLFALLSPAAIAQTDTEFWFAAPEVAIHQNYDRPIKFFITTYGQPSTVTISQPAAGGMPNQTVTIAANSTTAVDVTAWINNIEAAPANTILNYGIRITATTPVSVYYEVVSQQCMCNPEFFTLKGRNALGTDFYISSQNNSYNNPTYSPTPYSSFDIIATQNNTTVTVTPTKNIVGHASGVPFVITLNAGQVYSATATSQLATQHLEGSRVTSDKPIAITLRDDLITGPYGPCADLAGDQTVPVNMIGTEYIAVDGELFAPYDQVFVTATQNNTTISRNGTVLTTINAGATFQVALAGPSAYIQTSKPAYALQISGIGCELGTAVLPKLECSGSSSVSFARSAVETLTVTLIVKNGGQGNFRVNGVAGVITTGQFAAVPGTSNQYYAARVTLPVTQYPQGSIISISNTTHLFHLGVLNGSNTTGARFGYFSNYNLVSTTSWVDQPLCEADTIKLNTFSMAGATYSWTGPGNFTSSLQNPKIPNAGMGMSGKYALEVNVAGCISRDTVVVNIVPKPNVQINANTPVCEGQTLSFTNSQAGATYSWTGPMNFTSTVQSPTLANAQPVHSGRYIVTATVGSCSNKDTVNVQVNPKPTIRANPKTAAICPAGERGFKASGGNTYVWEPLTGITPTTGDTITVKQSGITKYIVTGTDNNGCSNKDSVAILLVGAPKITVSPKQSIVCPQSNVTLTAKGAASYIWSPSAGLNSTSGASVVAQPVGISYYVATGTDNNGCTGRDTAFIKMQDSILTNLYITVCEDSILMFGTKALKDTGRYRQPFKSAAGCDSIVHLYLAHLAGPQAAFVLDPIIPEMNKPIRFANQSKRATDYLWDFGDGNTSRDFNPEHLYVRSGQYRVCLTATAAGDCKDIFCRDAIAEILPLIDLPTGFSPNGDGNNDILELKGGAVKSVSLKIYNRWGSLVFETNSMNTGWDGTYKGVQQPVDVYAFILNATFIDGTTYQKKGNVTLTR